MLEGTLYDDKLREFAVAHGLQFTTGDFRGALGGYITWLGSHFFNEIVVLPGSSEPTYLLATQYTTNPFMRKIFGFQLGMSSMTAPPGNWDETSAALSELVQQMNATQLPRPTKSKLRRL